MILKIDGKNRAFQERGTDAVGEGIGVRYGDVEKSSNFGPGPELARHIFVWFGVAPVPMRPPHHPVDHRSLVDSTLQRQHIQHYHDRI